jgi:hypothetical protein
MGSIGIFLDTGGNDIYANEHHGNNKSWVSGLYGVGRDTEIIRQPAIETIVEESEFEIEKYTIDETMPIDELFAIAAQWDIVTIPRERVREARRILSEREAEAVEYILENRLNTGSISIQRTILDFARNSDIFKARISEGLSSDKPRAVSNTILFIGILGLTNYIETFDKMLTEEQYVNDILSALGRLSTDKSIDILARYIDSEDRYRRVIVVRSLKEINTDQSLNMILSIEDNNCFLIKSMIDIVQNEGQSGE